MANEHKVGDALTIIGKMREEGDGFEASDTDDPKLVGLCRETFSQLCSAVNNLNEELRIEEGEAKHIAAINDAMNAEPYSRVNVGLVLEEFATFAGAKNVNEFADVVLDMIQNLRDMKAATGESAAGNIYDTRYEGFNVIYDESADLQYKFGIKGK